jgi:CheY-like chemotaxis protein
MAGKSVLIVDDSRVARMMTRHLIEQNRPDWTIIEAETGEQAVERFQEERPDFTVMDVNMPGIDGLEACRRIRAIDKAAVITLLTANIQDPIRQHAQTQGIGFISKPLREDALMAFLDNATP